MRYPERSSSSSAPYRSSRDERERRGTGEESSHRTKSDTSRISHRDRYEAPSKGIRLLNISYIFLVYW